MASSSSNMEDPVTVEEIKDIGRRLISLPSSHVEQLHLLDEVKDIAPKATDCVKASRSTTVTKNSTDPNGKRDDASKGKKSSTKRKSTTQSKRQSSSKKIDTTKENEAEQPSKKLDTSNESEDELPIAALIRSNSQSKRSAKGESLMKTNKKQRTKSEIIATDGEEMISGLDSTEVQPKKRKQRTISEIIATTSEETKATGTISEKNRRKSRSRLRGEASKVKPKSVSTELNEDEAAKEACVIKVCGPKLVGRKIKVWWPEDREFYPGKIVSFDRASDKYEVLYQDGDMEVLDLKNEKWELLKDEEEMVSGSEAAPIDTTGSAPESETIAFVEVRGYMVKASAADTLEGIFRKYGDIASNCPYKSASVKASLLEIVCTALQKLQNDDSLLDFNEVESIINDADKAKLEIGWLKAELEKRVANEDGQKAKMLRGTKRQVLHAVKAAKAELKHRRAKLAVAQNQVEEAERSFNALRCVLKKFKDDIFEHKESREKRSKMV